MKLEDGLPTDRRLAEVYRWGAALCGLLLVVFGCLGLADQLSPFNTSGQQIAGLSTNGVLSVLSLVFGSVLAGAAFIGGNIASTVNMAVGALFVLSGFVHVFILDRSANILDFRMSNVIFSFVMGLLILCCGMYGRVSGRLPHDNPYWRARHPEQATDEDREKGLRSHDLLSGEDLAADIDREQERAALEAAPDARRSAGRR